MPERIVPAKNGSFTLYRGETALHSLYDPDLEAEKFIASLSLESRDYRCFILVEPGLGYMVPVLKKKFPAAPVVSLHCSAFFSSPDCAPYCRESGALSWSPGPDNVQGSLEDFLEDVLPAAAPDSIRLIEWRPAAAAYGKEFVEILSRTVEVIRRRAANRATVRGFGRRWLRNSLRNLGLFVRPAKPGRTNRPVVVCAAGPGLEEELSVLADLAASPNPPFFIAVSSALPCLVSAGIVPDIVAATDGGSWALLHLYEAVRLCGAKSFPASRGKDFSAAGKTHCTDKVRFACALSAALPSQVGLYPALILADGSVWQRWLLGSLGLPFTAFPQRGTVSASALDLAFFLGSGPVYISGLDLRHADLLTHCRPYALDRLRDERANRLAPAYSGAFEREAAIRRSQALSIYASWFKTELAKYPRLLYAVSEGNRLGIPQGPLGKGIWGSPAGGAETGRDEAACFTPGNGGDGGKGTSAETQSAAGFAETGRGDKAACFTAGNGGDGGDGVHILVRGLEDPRAGKRIAAELGELLFPGGENVNRADIENELRLLRRGLYG